MRAAGQILLLQCPLGEMTMRKNQYGNALWLILLAVFLLGALTVLLTRGASNTEETGESEKLRVEATKLLRFTSSVPIAVQRMLQNGVSENELSFANTFYQRCDDTPSNVTNPICTRPECQIFDTQGGGLKPVETPTALYDNPYTCGWFKHGSIDTKVINIMGVGTTAADLVLEVYWLNKQACLMLNKLSGVDNPGGDPPAENETTFCAFTGDYNCATETFGDDAPEVAGKKNFCTYRASDDAYFFHTVILAR